ncbi:hypothetical protein [Hydrogenophaga sp.]|uniref:hypothetical protein n=1 Tax=Hydrogenophaga sp. TaxID=1904254 RepID=UPI003F702AFB
MTNKQDLPPLPAEVDLAAMYRAMKEAHLALSLLTPDIRTGHSMKAAAMLDEILNAKPLEAIRSHEAERGAHASAAWENSEGWESLAWELCADENGEESCNQLIWEGGPIPEPWGDRWLKYEDEAKRLIALVKKHLPAEASKPVQAEAPSDAELNKLAEHHTWFNGSHAMTNYPAFARAVLRKYGATPPTASPAPSDVLIKRAEWDALTPGAQTALTDLVQRYRQAAPRNALDREFGGATPTASPVGEREARLSSEVDAITELNHAQWLALENIRSLAARHRKEEWAQHTLRWCEEAGNAARTLRAALATQPQEVRKPVAIAEGDKLYWIADRMPTDDQDRYLAFVDPAQPEQVAQDLTDDEINGIWCAKDNPQISSVLSPFGMDRIRAIIRAARTRGEGASHG